MPIIEIKRPDGGTLRCYSSEAGKTRPGVVVIQEWWGLNDQIMGIADRLARAGYNALAPDLYQGRVTAKPDEASHLMSGLDMAGATHQDIRAAAQYLRGRGSRVGVTGYCMGGALAIAAAVHVPEIDAAVCFYGLPDSSFADPAKLRVPMQGHFANDDNWCTPAKVDTLEAALRMAAVRTEIHRYDAAHGFCNERTEAYNVAAANLSWERMMQFFGVTLGH